MSGDEKDAKPCSCPPGPRGPPGRDATAKIAPPSGAVFTRWGRAECPKTSVLVYEGTASGSSFDEPGGGGNYLCLPRQPAYRDPTEGTQPYRAYLYGAEYWAVDHAKQDTLHRRTMPCAVCMSVGRAAQFTMPARDYCPTGWTREYRGYLMSSHYKRSRTEFICVDGEAEGSERSSRLRKSSRLVPVEVRCSQEDRDGSFPCGPYKNGHELTCAVCTV
ncbi:uncharacterized protein [Branchiostoma lanceolatum]|uniref:uncharacterized protein n=1 Tax=Branchiostoma lanceolatum TaxID=7740 RepID=UPI0034540E05